MEYLTGMSRKHIHAFSYSLCALAIASEMRCLIPTIVVPLTGAVINSAKRHSSEEENKVSQESMGEESRWLIVAGRMVS